MDDLNMDSTTETEESEESENEMPSNSKRHTFSNGTSAPPNIKQETSERQSAVSEQPSALENGHYRADTTLSSTALTSPAVRPPSAPPVAASGRKMLDLRVSQKAAFAMREFGLGLIPLYETIDNALEALIKYKPLNPTLSIAFHESEVIIRDNGPGMDVATLEKALRLGGSYRLSELSRADDVNMIQRCADGTGPSRFINCMFGKFGFGLNIAGGFSRKIRVRTQTKNGELLSVELDEEFWLHNETSHPVETSVPRDPDAHFTEVAFMVIKGGLPTVEEFREDLYRRYRHVLAPYHELPRRWVEAKDRDRPLDQDPVQYEPVKVLVNKSDLKDWGLDRMPDVHTLMQRCEVPPGMFDNPGMFRFETGDRKLDSHSMILLGYFNSYQAKVPPIPPMNQMFEIFWQGRFIQYFVPDFKSQRLNRLPADVRDQVIARVRGQIFLDDLFRPKPDKSAMVSEASVFSRLIDSVADTLLKEMPGFVKSMAAFDTNLGLLDDFQDCPNATTNDAKYFKRAEFRSGTDLKTYSQGQYIKMKDAEVLRISHFEKPLLGRGTRMNGYVVAHRLLSEGEESEVVQVNFPDIQSNPTNKTIENYRKALPHKLHLTVGEGTEMRCSGPLALQVQLHNVAGKVLDGDLPERYSNLTATLYLVGSDGMELETKLKRLEISGKVHAAAISLPDSSGTYEYVLRDDDNRLEESNRLVVKVAAGRPVTFAAEVLGTAQVGQKLPLRLLFKDDHGNIAKWPDGANIDIQLVDDTLNREFIWENNLERERGSAEVRTPAKSKIIGPAGDVTLIIRADNWISPRNITSASQASSEHKLTFPLQPGDPTCLSVRTNTVVEVVNGEVLDLSFISLIDEAGNTLDKRCPLVLDAGSFKIFDGKTKIKIAATASLERRIVIAPRSSEPIKVEVTTSDEDIEGCCFELVVLAGNIFSSLELPPQHEFPVEATVGSLLFTTEDLLVVGRTEGGEPTTQKAESALSVWFSPLNLVSDSTTKEKAEAFLHDASDGLIHIQNVVAPMIAGLYSLDVSYRCPESKHVHQLHVTDIKVLPGQASQILFSPPLSSILEKQSLSPDNPKLIAHLIVTLTDEYGNTVSSAIPPVVLDITVTTEDNVPLPIVGFEPIQLHSSNNCKVVLENIALELPGDMRTQMLSVKFSTEPPMEFPEKDTFRPLLVNNRDREEYQERIASLQAERDAARQRKTDAMEVKKDTAAQLRELKKSISAQKTLQTGEIRSWAQSVKTVQQAVASCSDVKETTATRVRQQLESAVRASDVASVKANFEALKKLVSLLSSEDKKSEKTRIEYRDAVLGPASSDSVRLANKLSSMTKEKHPVRSVKEVIGIAGLLGTAPTPELAKTLAAILGPNMTTVVLRKRAAKHTLPDEFRKTLSVIALDMVQTYDAPRSISADGCLGYAWQLIQLRKETRSELETVYRALMGNVLVFTTEDAAVQYRMANLKSHTRIPTLFTLDGCRIESSGVEIPPRTASVASLAIVPSANSSPSSGLSSLVDHLKRLSEKASSVIRNLNDHQKKEHELLKQLDEEEAEYSNAEADVKTATAEFKQLEDAFKAALKDLKTFNQQALPKPQGPTTQRGKQVASGGARALRTRPLPDDTESSDDEEDNEDNPDDEDYVQASPPRRGGRRSASGSAKRKPAKPNLSNYYRSKKRRRRY